MSIARHHVEWLSLIDQSGPFLSIPVLMRAFPQGLDKQDPELKKELRLAFDEWQQEQNNPAIQTSWIKFVISQILEFPDDLIKEGQSLPPGLSATVLEQNEVLRPDLAIINSNGNTADGKPHLLIQAYAVGQRLESAISGKHWKASPATRMMELLHATDIPLGLVTNGEQWMLVFAPRNETTGYASWYASLWLEEPVTFQAFVSLMSVRRFFGVSESDTLLALLDESSKNQQEVTNQLGLQVRQAVEVLVQAFDRLDQDSGRTLLKGIDEKKLYEAALTVMMRLVFLFCAEERKLLPIDEYALYAQSYAVSNLGAQLREIADKHGEEILERSFDAWSRLLATFRAVYAGVEHDAMRLPPYGGNLFNPDRFPFLEGRPAHGSWRDTIAEPLRIDNRTVLHLLEALQWLAIKMPGGGPKEKRRLSFRALDIEQIGHVYEGLLDHTAVRATEAVLGLIGAKGQEPELLLQELESKRQKGEDELIELLTEETGRNEKTLRKAITEPPLADEAKLRVACRNDEKLMARVHPYVGLIRDDTFGYPVVISEGSVYVTSGTDRRSSGTHYTPRSLTEPIVQHTLEPLVYIGPAEGKPKEKWQLRSAREILELKVCDMAMGSGAFLVQACRYLSERLLEAWENAEKSLGGNLQITPEGDRAKGVLEERLAPVDPDERLAIAMRIIAERCLYGVDKNPLAVEMAKLSLWLITLSKGKPFTFLNHALKCGDSLVGADENMFLEWAHGGNKDQVTIFDAKLKKLLDEARHKRKELESFEVKDVHDSERKADLLDEADIATTSVKIGCDLLIGTKLLNLSSTYEQARLNKLLIGYQKDLFARGLEATEANNTAGACHVFHWPFEYPEIYERGGFDALIGNPPFMGGQKITGNLGTEYREYLVNNLANGMRGSADLCSYFFLRAYQLLKNGGCFGMLATNTIAQGDTREVGLEQIEKNDGKIIKAIPSQKWPGQANLEIAVCWIAKGNWNGEYNLQDIIVSGISPFLSIPSEVVGKPYRLAANANKSFQGSIVLGMGFIMAPEEAMRLIEKDPKNKDVLFPYLNGEDLNSRPDQSPSRWVINFFDWPLNRFANGNWEKADTKKKKEWLRLGQVPSDYLGPVAADYPDCLKIVEEKAKPERTRKDENGEFVLRYPLYLKWWIYAEKRPALYSTIARLERVLTIAATSQTLAFTIVNSKIVFSHATYVFALHSYSDFILMQSSMHDSWARKYASSMKGDLRYTPSDCFETFPFPESIFQIENLGKDFYNSRKDLLAYYNIGLTALYRKFHDPGIKDRKICNLRDMYVSIDSLVGKTFGWHSLMLDHGFYKTKKGNAFTISEKARREVLSRLLKLNHERYAEEVAQGLHDKKKVTSKVKGRKNSVGERGLFDNID